ncbi:hypothetical protein OAO01_04880 [Oligoflexia bacterium]|nr:hypothetical protein [Oligoflexia bacterium]
MFGQSYRSLIIEALLLSIIWLSSVPAASAETLFEYFSNSSDVIDSAAPATKVAKKKSKAAIKAKIKKLSKKLKHLYKQYNVFYQADDWDKQAFVSGRIGTVEGKISALKNKIKSSFCGKLNTAIILVVENNSALDLELNLVGGIQQIKTVGVVKPEAIVKIKLSAEELLAPGAKKWKNLLNLNASFGGENIKDTDIAQQVDYEFSTPKFPKKEPCEKEVKVELFNTNFGPSVIVPPDPSPTPKPLQLLGVDVPGSIKSGGAKGDLVIYWSGEPAFPVAASYYPVSCPANVNYCSAVPGSFSSADKNPYVMSGAVWCSGFSQNTYINYALKLTDANGHETQSINAGFNCVAP